MTIGTRNDGADRPLRELGEEAVALCASLGERPGRVRITSGADSVEIEWHGAAAGATELPARPVAPAAPPAARPDEPAEVPAVPEVPASPAALSGPVDTVVAPLVGTFYGAPAPGEPAFVAVGDTVTPGQQVGIVEAMKLMNVVTTARGGTVASVRVSDGEMVEFGQVLVEIDPSGG